MMPELSARELRRIKAIKASDAYNIPIRNLMKLSIIDDSPDALNQVISTDEPFTSGPSDTTDNPEQLYNQTQLAKKFKMSRNLVIERLEDAGIEPAEDNGPRGRKYRLGDVEAVLVHKVLKSDRKLAATERKLEAEAELKELEVLKRKGEAILVSDVELGAVQLFRALHNRLVQYCDDSALDISRLRTRGEVSAYQKEHIGKIEQDLRSDPNNFVTRYLNDE